MVCFSKRPRIDSVNVVCIPKQDASGRPAHEEKFVKFLMKRNMSNLKKVRMDYSCHGRYKGIHIVFSLFSLLSS